MNNTQKANEYVEVQGRQELSKWYCEIYPKSPGCMIIRPKNGEPCWFHRKMQELVFGVKWIEAGNAE